MRKVLHVAKYYYPFKGGTEQTSRDCVKSLLNRYEQKVICFNDGDVTKKDYVDGVEVIRSACFAKFASQPISVFSGSLIKAAINDFEPDIVIFHYPNPLVAYFVLKYLPTTAKLIIYWHTDIIKQKFLRLFFEIQNKRLLKRADAIVATSPAYIDGSPYLSTVREKCHVIPSCIDINRLQVGESTELLAERIRKENKGKLICFAVGRHTKYKGFKYLIQASKYLDDRFEIFICGKGEETKGLKREATNDKKIHFLGCLDDDELKGYFLAMDIFCFPSITRNEAFGLALAEGMYYMKPAVTFTIPGSGVNYVCLDHKNGIEVPNRDIKAYAEAVKRLADDPSLRERLGVAGKRRVVEEFSYEKYRDNILHLLTCL